MSKGMNDDERVAGIAPIGPLERYLRNRFELVDADLYQDRDRVASDVTFARLAGVERRTWKRWRTTGINERSADRAAVNLGVHPSYIWSEHDLTTCSSQAKAG